MRRSRWQVLVGLLVLVLVAGVLFVENRERWWPRKWAAVIEGELYRSGELHPALVEETLREHGIRDIVVLTKRVEGDFEQDAEAEAVSELDIISHRFPLRGDGTGDIEQYAGALMKVSEALAAGRPCLVHCAAGTERTGLTIAFYRILMEGRSRSYAVEEMVAAGMNPARNKVILPYLDENLGRLRKLLIERGVAVLPSAES